MKIYRARNVLGLIWVFGFLLLLPKVELPAAPAAEANQFGGLINRVTGGDKKDDDEKKDENKDEQQTSEANYAKILAYGLNKYETDPEFKKQCDEAYRQLQFEHSQHAYIMNTSKYGEAVKVEGDATNNVSALYDNPVLQAYINRVGQSLVPADSNKIYAFRIVMHPIPMAQSLSTGTVYVSSGLISQLDNEAQLAYLLGHEIAHVHMDHWKTKKLVELALVKYNEEGSSSAARKGLMTGLVSAAGAGIGALAGGREGALYGALAGAAAGYVVAEVTSRKKIDVDWTTAQEDEADDFAFKLALQANYDVREVPNLYQTLRNTTQFDYRAGLAFMGNPDRVRERTERVNHLLADTFKSEIESKLAAGSLIGTSPDFSVLMAELKRDNGSLAYYYDMFYMCRTNLEQSIAIRSSDPRSHYYLGKVLRLTARTPEEKEKATQSFDRAIQLDKDRGHYAEPYLEKALALIDLKDASKNEEIVTDLKQYVSLYQKNHGGSLPDNIEVIYDYMLQNGDSTWSAPPVVNVSEKITSEKAAGK